MKTKKTFAFMMMGAILALATLWMPISTEAQAVLRNQNRLNRGDIERIIVRLENSSDRFRRAFDQQMDRNRRSNDDQYVGIVNEFEESVDRLRSEFNNNTSWWQPRNQVSEMVREAQDVNVMMNSLSFRRSLETQWNAMRTDINTLADTFDLPGLNGGGWQGGNNGGGWNNGMGGGGRPVRPPTWAVGTFYSTNGTNEIQLTIGADGYASVINDGQTYQGKYTRNGLWVNGDSSTLQQTRNGLRTYNKSQGVWTNYRRNRNNGGGGVDPNMGSRPPTWAIGTFVPNSISDMSMTIDAAGRVTVYRDGQTYYGTYNGQNNTLNLNNDMSTVTQSGRGIRTYNSRTGETTNYRRQ